MQNGQRRGKFKRKEKPEFDQQIVDLARVTRVTKGGKQLSFRAGVVIGDRNGRVGQGVQKGKDVQIAVEKAVKQAKKNMILVPRVNGTVPHSVLAKYKAAKVMIKPAPRGSGIIAGGVVRTVLEMAGVKNASAKMLGKSNNKINNVKATFEALQSFNNRALNRVKLSEEKRNAKKKDASNTPEAAKAKKEKATGDEKKGEEKK